MKYAFIVLNYNTEKQTLTCIEEILRHTTKINEKRVFILDNGSNNSRLKDDVESLFYDNNNILFFYSEKNLGFARGNNYLYKIAKETFDPDFYIFLNNDVYIVSNDFCCQLRDEYCQSKFSVLGPRIILGNNTIDACSFDLPSVAEVKKEILYWKTIKFLAKIHLATPFVYSKIAKDLICKYLHLSGYQRIDKSKRRENVLLQGACLVFSREYFKCYAEPFDNRTFLYKEEELVLLRCIKKSMKTVFSPSMIVYHEGGVSTIKNRNKNQLFAFRADYYIMSLTILLNELCSEKGVNIYEKNCDYK